MSSENGKVHKLESVKGEATQGEGVQEAVPAQGVADAQRDMSKVAMIVSLLADPACDLLFRHEPEYSWPH